MESDYTIFRAPGMTGKVLNTGSNCVFDPVSLLCLPDDPKFCCKRGNTVQAAADGTFFVKRICHRTLWDSFRNLFKRPRPELCLEAAGRLERAGVATPSVLAICRQYRGFLPRFDFLITEDIGAKVVFADKMPHSQQTISELCALLAKMHANGIEHGDVNLRNLYRCKDSGSWGAIDLDGCRLNLSPLSADRRIHELARFSSSLIKQARCMDMAADFPEDPAGFAARQYKLCSGLDPDTSIYRRRVEYLSQRRRK